MRSRSINVWRSAHPPWGLSSPIGLPRGRALTRHSRVGLARTRMKEAPPAGKTRSRCAPEPGIESPYRNTRTDSRRPPGTRAPGRRLPDSAPRAAAGVLPPSSVTTPPGAFLQPWSPASVCRRTPSRRAPLIIDRDVGVHTKISLSVSRRVVSPACIAGVLVSRPNFNALCGRTKL